MDDSDDEEDTGIECDDESVLDRSVYRNQLHAFLRQYDPLSHHRPAKVPRIEVDDDVTSIGSPNSSGLCEPSTGTPTGGRSKHIPSMPGRLGTGKRISSTPNGRQSASGGLSNGDTDITKDSDDDSEIDFDEDPMIDRAVYQDQLHAFLRRNDPLSQRSTGTSTPTCGVPEHTSDQPSGEPSQHIQIMSTRSLSKQNKSLPAGRPSKCISSAPTSGLSKHISGLLKGGISEHTLSPSSSELSEGIRITSTRLSKHNQSSCTSGPSKHNFSALTSGLIEHIPDGLSEHISGPASGEFTENIPVASSDVLSEHGQGETTGGLRKQTTTARTPTSRLSKRTPSRPTSTGKRSARLPSRTRTGQGNQSVPPEFVWKQEVCIRETLEFTERVGVKQRLQSNKTALEVFQFFFTDDIINFIVSMTNLNARRKLAAAGSQEWTDTSSAEIKAFMGLVFAMGIFKIPIVALYWQLKNWIFDWSAPNKILSRNRFMNLWKYIHFCDENNNASSDLNQDKLYKIRPLLDLLAPRLLSVYTPGKQICIDESMIPFKGRLSFRQFIPTKRTRCGIKAWVLAESTTGYVPCFQIYTGRDCKTHETGLPTRVVNDLMQPFLGKGYHLYLDNFYTSPELVRQLYVQKVYVCGTVRPGRRGFPRELILPPKAPKGTKNWTMSQEILAQSWMDNRPVYFLSTIHSPEFSPNYQHKKFVTRRGGVGKQPVQFECPPLLHDYNHYMGGVDRNDAMRKYYNIGRKSRTWYRRIFFYLLEVVLHNSQVVAYSILRPSDKKRFSNLSWRMDLITQLIGDHRVPKAASKRATTDLGHRMQNVGRHLPTCEQYLRVCKVCSKKASQENWERRPSRTKYCCKECDVHLCISEEKNCFADWHSKIEFWR